MEAVHPRRKLAPRGLASLDQGRVVGAATQARLGLPRSFVRDSSVPRPCCLPLSGCTSLPNHIPHPTRACHTLTPCISTERARSRRALVPGARILVSPLMAGVALSGPRPPRGRPGSRCARPGPCTPALPSAADLDTGVLASTNRRFVNTSSRTKILRWDWILRGEQEPTMLRGESSLRPSEARGRVGCRLSRSSR